MNLIRNPCRYSSLQTKVVNAVVHYVYDYCIQTQPAEATRCVFELTEHIARLGEINHYDLDNRPEHCCEALFKFNQIQGVQALVNQNDADLKATEKGFVLLARWIQALHDYAKLTN